MAKNAIPDRKFTKRITVHWIHQIIAAQSGRALTCILLLEYQLSNCCGKKGVIYLSNKRLHTTIDRVIKIEKKKR